MKTKKLIELLNEADPSGELEVCIGNVDIHFVECLPAYYDGPLQVLERDESKFGYNIVGGKYKRSGEKVKIHELSFVDAITNFGPNTIFNVDYSELGKDQAEKTKKAHDDLRLWNIKLENEIELEHFLSWVKSLVEKLTSDMETYKDVATKFFKANIKHDDSFGPDGIPEGHSYNSARELQWAKKIKVFIDEGFINIEHIKEN